MQRQDLRGMKFSGKIDFPRRIEKRAFRPDLEQAFSPLRHQTSVSKKTPLGTK